MPTVTAPTRRRRLPQPQSLRHQPPPSLLGYRAVRWLQTLGITAALVGVAGGVLAAMLLAAS